MTLTTYIEIKVEVEYDATPYRPAQTYGPPEACYPEEGGEVEITATTYNGQPITLTDADEKIITDEIVEKLAGEPERDYEE